MDFVEGTKHFDKNGDKISEEESNKLRAEHLANDTRAQTRLDYKDNRIQPDDPFAFPEDKPNPITEELAGLDYSKSQLVELSHSQEPQFTVEELKDKCGVLRDVDDLKGLHGLIALAAVRAGGTAADLLTLKEDFAGMLPSDVESRGNMDTLIEWICKRTIEAEAKKLSAAV